MKSLAKTMTGLGLGVALTAGASFTAVAAQWSNTELQYQYGNLKKAFEGGGSESETGGTNVLTFQHASGWKYGDNFFFIDYLDYGQTDYEEANGTPATSEMYGELYMNFSLGKIFRTDLSFPGVRDFGVIAGLNMAPEVNALYYLPGFRIAWDIPAFAFANLDIMAYIQGSDSNPADGVEVSEDDSWMADFNWGLPFNIGPTKWLFEGHIEYVKESESITSVSGVGNLDDQRETWILAQPQLRLDLGHFWGSPDVLFVGVEYQYWSNKLGDPETTDNVAQALVVWRL